MFVIIERTISATGPEIIQYEAIVLKKGNGKAKKELKIAMQEDIIKPATTTIIAISIFDLFFINPQEKNTFLTKVILILRLI